MEKRFYVSKDNILNNIITLQEEEHQHLSKVLRLRVGDNVECFYNGSEIFECEIIEITKNYSTLKILSSKVAQTNPKLNVSLYQGLPKLDKLELITQKITEIGLTALVPFGSAFCVAKQNDNKTERLKKIVISACKQCGRTKLLEVKQHETFNEILKSLQKFNVVIFANETENKVSLKSILTEQKNKNITSVAIVVGSEGGFSKEEIDKLSSMKNVYSVSLGARILRTETASIVLASLVQYELNEI